MEKTYIDEDPKLCNCVKEQIDMILNRQVFAYYFDGTEGFNLHEFIGDKKVILSLLKFALVYNRGISVLDLKYDSQNDISSDINNTILQLLRIKNIPLNYWDNQKIDVNESRHTPLSFALSHGFCDVVNKMSDNENLDINLRWQKDMLSDSHHPLELLWFSYDEKMVNSGAYKSLINRDDLNLSSRDYIKLCHTLIEKCNIGDINNILGTLEIFKLLEEKDRLTTIHKRQLQPDISTLEKKAHLLIPRM